MKRFLAAAATAGLLVIAAPAAPASATTCHENCIYICWECLEGPHVGCWYVQDVGKICV